MCWTLLVYKLQLFTFRYDLWKNDYSVLHEQRNHVHGFIFGGLVIFRTVVHEFIVGCKPFQNVSVAVLDNFESLNDKTHFVRKTLLSFAQCKKDPFIWKELPFIYCSTWMKILIMFINFDFPSIKSHLIWLIRSNRNWNVCLFVYLKFYVTHVNSSLICKLMRTFNISCIFRREECENVM